MSTITRHRECGFVGATLTPLVMGAGATHPAQGSFLDVLDPQQASALRRVGSVRRYPRGVALFHERQLADRALVLLTGRVKVTRTTSDGREIMLGVRDAGDLVGELSAIDGQPRCAAAITLEPVEVLAVPAASFATFLENSPIAALALLRTVTGRLREADHKCVEFAAQDSTGRVAARLVDLAERYGINCADAIRIDLALSQEELASWTACSRDAVTKALQTMRGLGWITTGRRTITVLQLAALQERAGAIRDRGVAA